MDSLGVLLTLYRFSHICPWFVNHDLIGQLTIPRVYTLNAAMSTKSLSKEGNDMTKHCSMQYDLTLLGVVIKGLEHLGENCQDLPKKKQRRLHAFFEDRYNDTR